MIKEQHLCESFNVKTKDGFYFKLGIIKGKTQKQVLIRGLLEYLKLLNDCGYKTKITISYIKKLLNSPFKQIMNQCKADGVFVIFVYNHVYSNNYAVFAEEMECFKSNTQTQKFHKNLLSTLFEAKKAIDAEKEFNEFLRHGILLQ